LLEGGVSIDGVSEPLGIRSFAVDRERGFFLNGTPYPLRGVNKHQDRPGKGWAISEADMAEDYSLMAEMGVTAIRMAHYQHPVREYELADSLGMILWTEIPVVNSITANGAFTDNAVQQLRELIRQNINHPSVVFWGIANEITLRPGPDPQPLMRHLAAEAKRQDPSRLTAIASAAGDNHPTNWNTDVAGFNKYFGWYVDSLKDFAPWVDRLHRERTKPSERIGVTEYGAGASIRFHADTLRIMDHTEEYQSLYHEVYWNAMSERPFIWGTFVWNMFDFAVDSRKEGDTPGRNDKGLVTFDRKVRKDAFFWYKANWTAAPMAYIASRRFTPRPVSPVTVTVYTNLEQAELEVNGRSLGIRPAEHHTVRWDHVPLARGKNRVEVKGVSGFETVGDSVVWDH
jgi:beta-galactosidase